MTRHCAIHSAPPLRVVMFATGLDGEDDCLLRRLQGQPSARDDDVLQSSAGVHPHHALLLPPQSRPCRQSVSFLLLARTCIA